MRHFKINFINQINTSYSRTLFELESEILVPGPFVKPSFGAETCVVVIDMQPYFLDQFSRQRRDSLVKAQGRGLGALSRSDCSLAVVEYGGYNKSIKEVRDYLPQFRRAKSVKKFQDDAFHSGLLVDWLVRWRVNDLVVMGINASGCVQRTCEKAITLVYPVCTALDVIANNDKDVEQVHYNTCIPWYRENCRVFESSRDLVNC